MITTKFTSLLLAGLLCTASATTLAMSNDGADTKGTQSGATSGPPLHPTTLPARLPPVTVQIRVAALALALTAGPAVRDPARAAAPGQLAVEQEVPEVGPVAERTKNRP